MIIADKRAQMRRTGQHDVFATRWTRALLHSLLAESGSWVTLIQGVIFIACVQFFREGFVGTLSKRLRPARATRLPEQA